MTQAPLIIDIAGPELTETDRRRLAHPLVGGLILFRRNWRDSRQLTRLCAAIKQVRPDVLIGVDQEGGRVQRFQDDGFTRLPAMRTLGALWSRDAMRAQDAATACGYVLAAELRACGVDLSFAPVLDLDWGHSAVIGDRAFHRNPKVVATLAKSVLHGLLQAGLAHCAKHFPGHGYAAADSHTTIPHDARALATILKSDAAPYRWLGSVLSAVMPAHVVYPRVDALPAGFSARWLQQVLRDELGFDGAIISDDLSMAGARTVQGRTMTRVQSILAALGAGCDLALLCNQSLEPGDVIDGVLADLSEAQRQGSWIASDPSERRRRALLPRFPGLNWDALRAAPTYQRALRHLP
jgi:beta-N-acetylhexosaminidase